MISSIIRQSKLVAASLVAASLIVGALFSPAVSQASDFTSASASEALSSEQTRTTAESDLDFATAPMPDLEVTVSQTSNLSAQGLTVSWQGANPNSVRPSGNGGANFLQIFQCWGDDPDLPGHPDRSTCQYGAFLKPGSSRSNTVSLENVDPNDMKYTKPGTDWASPPYTSIPFKSATGEQVWDLKKDSKGELVYNPGVSMSANQFFSPLSTNEINWAGSNGEGKGSAKFELHTASEAPGLGCGKPTKVAGKTAGKSCWLVVLPRGIADNKQSDISKSGLFWDSWKHHIAFKLDFRPIGVRCEIGVPERQVQGTEAAVHAFASWQPKLCGGQVKSAFVFSNQFDADVIESASSNTSSPLAIVSGTLLDSKSDPLVYAPLAVSGVSLSFSIDRAHDTSGDVPQEVKDRDQTAFTEMNLTPRLLAKLLTYSYTQSLPDGGNFDHVKNNLPNITRDPEFLEANKDETDWQHMLLDYGGIADALSPNTRSFLAERLWKYIQSDASARDFMAGKPDETGMTVNPWFCTDAKINLSGSAFTLPNFAFPKSDPVEKPDTTMSNSNQPSGSINLVGWRPYLNDFEAGAQSTLSGNAFEIGAWDPTSAPPAFKKGARRALGLHRSLALSTSASAEKFQSFEVSFLNPAGSFVKPSLISLSAARDAMTALSNNPNVVEFNFESDEAKAATEAYPLAVLLYAALNPLQTNSTDRFAFANLIKYAVSEGQALGTNPGNLPPGYAPLSVEQIKQSLASAQAIEDGVSPLGNPSTGEPLPTLAPTVEPLEQPSISAGTTPEDPQPPLSSASIPFACALFICAFLIYGLLRKRMPRI